MIYTGWAITDNDALGTYFSCNVKGLKVGGVMQWTGDKEEALLFARKIDAESFANRYMSTTIYRIKQI